MRDRKCSGVLFMLLAVAVAGVAAVGDPVAVDDSATTDHNTAVLVDVLANDTGTNPPLEIIGVTDPANGETEIVNGQIRYTPDPSFHGTDTFQYTIEDAASNTDTASVTVTVHFVNRPPVAQYKEFTTKIDNAVRFMLRATDPDLDVNNPDDHPLSFTILAFPSDGTLDGDIESVRYEPPNTAYVEMTYTPNPGFTGTDAVHFMVTDQFGASSTATVEFDVVREYLPMGAFSGNWRADLTLRGPTLGIQRFDTNATVFYRINSYNFQFRVNISDLEFNSLSIVGTVPVGGFATVRSTLLFDPRVPEFQYWQNVTRFTAFDTDFTHTFHLTGEEATSYNQLVARGTVDGLSFISTTRFTGLTLAFDYQLITLRWRWDVCELPVDARFRFTKAGFDDFRIAFRDIRIPCPDCTYLRLYADLQTIFTTDSKEVVPVFRLRSDWECCVRGYFALDHDDDEGSIRLGGIYFYGYEIRLALEGGIELRSVTSLVTERNASVTGFSDYFEFWMLTGPISACCGAPGRWQLATYFIEDRSELFGWGMTRFVLEFPVAPAVRIFNQLSIRSEDDPWQWEWKVGWTARW